MLAYANWGEAFRHYRGVFLFANTSVHFSNVLFDRPFWIAVSVCARGSVFAFRNVFWECRRSGSIEDEEFLSANTPLTCELMSFVTLAFVFTVLNSTIRKSSSAFVVEKVSKKNAGNGESVCLFSQKTEYKSRTIGNFEHAFFASTNLRAKTVLDLSAVLAHPRSIIASAKFLRRTRCEL